MHEQHKDLCDNETRWNCFGCMVAVFIKVYMMQKMIEVYMIHKNDGSVHDT